MGFEAPLALVALAAAALPVIAHLLRRQDLPLRKLPTIALLRRAQVASRRRVRLVDLLLLVARVLLIALAALAIAQPFVRVRLPYGDGTIASVAIVVDDSMSMAARGRPTLLDRALDRARDVLASLPEGSEAAIVLAGAPARLLVTRTAELGAARRALDEARGPSARGTDLAGAVSLAERELGGARNAERRLIVLSDATAHAGLADVTLPRGVAVEIERVGEGEPIGNAAIVDARATPDPTSERASIAVEVRASGMDGREIDLILRRGGEELARQELAIDGGGARATLQARIDPADPAAELVLEVDDAMAADDVRGVLLRAPAGARVWIVEDEPGRDDPSRFFVRAIDLAPGDGGALTHRRVDPETFAATDPGEADVIVLGGVPVPGELGARRLREHVERGGGLLVAPGDGFDPREYAARLGALLPARPRAMPDEVVGGPFAAPDQALLPEGASGLEQTRTRRRLALEAADEGAQTPLVFEDGSPALVVGRHGQGRVALLATTLDDAWTDLPYRPGYVPLVVRLLRTLAPSGGSGDDPIAPHASNGLHAPAGAVRMVVVAPDGERSELEGARLGGRVDFERTGVAGVYRVQVATRDLALREEPRLAFLVAPPAEESDLTPGELPEIETRDAEALRGSIAERPLAPWLFLLVGVLAIAEAGLRLRAGQLAQRTA